jgi:dihydroorotase
MSSPVRRPPDHEDVTPPEPVGWILAGRAFVRGRLQPVEIAVSDTGRIVSVGKVRSGGPRHDVGEAVILPSATDLHVHFRDPSPTAEAESMATGTMQAALGGVAVVGDMPNTDPPVNGVEALREKESRVAGRAAVDVLLYASPLGARNLETLARRAGAFKIYLSPTTNIPTPEPLAEVASLLQRLEPLGLPVSVHAEDPHRFAAVPQVLDAVQWDGSRPPEAERAAVAALTRSPPGLRLNIAHATTAETVTLARSSGLSCEATPHHLLLSDRSPGGTRVKVNPPLRSEAQRRALWEAFARGEVPFLASDHAPHSLDAKDRPFPDAPSGMPGVETMLPLLLARVKAQELELSTLLAAACDRPARWLGQPQGRIAAGHRANLLVVDFRTSRRLTGSGLHAPCGWTAFEGWDGIFPREHYLDGHPIVMDGTFRDDHRGRVVRPEYADR